MVSRPQEVSTDSEEMLHDTVNRREPLELSGRREPPHLALPLTRRSWAGRTRTPLVGEAPSLGFCRSVSICAPTRVPGKPGQGGQDDVM